jgi:cardiolipin synthase
VAQIVFACVVLALLSFDLKADNLTLGLTVTVTVLTLLSVAAYVREFIRHMNSVEAER